MVVDWGRTVRIGYATWQPLLAMLYIPYTLAFCSRLMQGAARGYNRSDSSGPGYAGSSYALEFDFFSQSSPLYGEPRMISNRGR